MKRNFCERSKNGNKQKYFEKNVEIWIELVISSQDCVNSERSYVLV